MCLLEDFLDRLPALILSIIFREGKHANTQKFYTLHQLCSFHYRCSYLLYWSANIHDSQILSRNVCWSFQCYCSSFDKINQSFLTFRFFRNLSATVHYNRHFFELFFIIYSFKSVQRSQWIELLAHNLRFPINLYHYSDIYTLFCFSTWNAQIFGS